MTFLKIRINYYGIKPFISYEELPENYNSFLKICTDLGIEYFSKYWTDADGEQVQIRDSKSYLMFLKLAPKKIIESVFDGLEIRGEIEKAPRLSFRYDNGEFSNLNVATVVDIENQLFNTTIRPNANGKQEQQQQQQKQQQHSLQQQLQQQPIGTQYSQNNYGFNFPSLAATEMRGANAGTTSSIQTQASTIQMSNNIEEENTAVVDNIKQCLGGILKNSEEPNSLCASLSNNKVGIANSTMNEIEINEKSPDKLIDNTNSLPLNSPGRAGKNSLMNSELAYNLYKRGYSWSWIYKFLHDTCKGNYALATFMAYETVF